MPAQTPIYNFPYPCPGETVSSGSFAALASAIDTKLVDLQTYQTAALSRPSTRRISAVNAGVAAAEQITAGANATIVIPTAGFWVSTVTVQVNTFPVGTTAGRLRVFKNAVAQFASSKDVETSATVFRFMTTGPMVCAAGDTITTGIFVNGAGAINWYTILEAKLMVQIGI